METLIQEKENQVYDHQLASSSHTCLSQDCWRKSSMCRQLNNSGRFSNGVLCYHQGSNKHLQQTITHKHLNNNLFFKLKNNKLMVNKYPSPLHSLPCDCIPRAHYESPCDDVIQMCQQFSLNQISLNDQIQDLVHSV